MKRSLFLIPILLLLLASTPFSGLAQQVQPAESPLLTVDSVFTYRTKSLGPVQWQRDGSGYLALEPSPTKKEFLDIVRYDALTGERTIKVSVEKLTPQGTSSTLRVEESLSVLTRKGCLSSQTQSASGAATRAAITG